MSAEPAEASQLSDDATFVIDQFGGIRPMASKTGIPVTTIQGWKKRGRIPAKRRADISKMAAHHDIDLTAPMSFVADEPAVVVRTPKAERAPKAARVNKESSQAQAQAAVDDEASSSQGLAANDGGDYGHDVSSSDLLFHIQQDLRAMEKQILTKNAVFSFLLMGLVGVALLAVVWPSKDDAQAPSGDDPRVSALAQDVSAVQGAVKDVKQEQGRLAGLIPTDLGAQLDGLKAQVAEQASAAVDASQGTALEGLAAAQKRLAALEARVPESLNVQGIQTFATRVQGMVSEAEGGGAMRNVVQDLWGSIQGAPEGDEQALEAAVEEKRRSDPAFASVFEGVPAQDLKAAAYLVALTQFRQTLNRDNQSFEADYALLQRLAASEDPILSASLKRLAPSAQSGVLTVGGLGDELKSLSGDIVVASLSGEDVSVADRAKARMNSILQIEKDGELVSGTPVQASVAKAEGYLAQGDVSNALAEMRTLEGPAAEVVKPWLLKAEGTLKAQHIQQMIDRTVTSFATKGSGMSYIISKPRR